MIILKDVTDICNSAQLRPGEIPTYTFVSPRMLQDAVFVAYYTDTEVYILKSKYTLEKRYAKTEDLIELVNFVIARQLNK